MSNGVNPLAGLSDRDLFDTQLTLAIACGRSKSALRQKHRVNICTLFQLLKIEADHRGRPSPAPPYKA
jgi:hypothetical protein